MKVKYIGDYYKVRLCKNKVYDVICVEGNWYRIIDETDDNGLFAPEQFEIINN